MFLTLVGAFGISLIVVLATMPLLISYLHKINYNQTVSEYSLEEYKQKQKTPTMGGIVFVLTPLAVTLLLQPGAIRDLQAMIVMLAYVGYGLIGFLDDYIKIVMKRSEGLNPIQKLIGQFIITGIFTYYLMTSGEVGTGMLIPFTGGFENGYYLNLGWLFIPAVFFIVLGTDNGVNFTDGLDGLCTSVTILVATFFTVVAIGENSGISPITGAVVGSLLGFLLFNVYPAKVFMGDKSEAKRS